MLNDTYRERISLEQLLRELNDRTFLMIERGIYCEYTVCCPDARDDDLPPE